MSAFRGSMPKIDVHVHLAGVGTRGSGCWSSPQLRRRPSFLGLRMVLGITNRQMATTVDQDWGALVSGLVADSELDLAVVIGFDGVYDAQGMLDLGRSQLVVPLGWVFETCERYTNLLPAPSINPRRRDALDRLDEAIGRGAALIKWLPVVQAFDPAGPEARSFLRRMADAGIPLLIHAGTGELTFRTIDRTVGRLQGILPALEEGVTVICAHTAAPIHFLPERSELPLLASLLERFPNLWVDNSGLANPGRFAHLPRFARDPLIAERTLHGSDFPIISSPAYYLRELGRREVARLAKEINPLQKEIEIKRSLGVPEACLTRASSLLANLSRWYAAPVAIPTQPPVE